MLLALAVGPAELFAQCSMCKSALTGSAEGRSLAGSLNQAILVMLAAPYLIMGTFGAVFFRATLKERLRRLGGRLLRGPRLSSP